MTAYRPFRIFDPIKRVWVRGLNLETGISLVLLILIGVWIAIRRGLSQYRCIVIISLFVDAGPLCYLTMLSAVSNDCLMLLVTL
jgi:hypothetical protein